MAVDVEAIWAALFDRLSAAPGFVTYSRRRRTWALEQMPVLMVLDDAGDEAQVDADDRARDGLPPLLRLTGEITILTQASDEDVKPTATLNGLVRAVRAALEATPADASATGRLRYWTDLDGLVESLAIGRVEKGLGVAVGELAARMEIVIEVLS